MGRWQAALAAYRVGARGRSGQRPRPGPGQPRRRRGWATSGAARDLAEQAVRVQPRNAPAHEALGAALEAAGKRADAKKALERAVEIDPRLESAKERLKKLRWSFLG